MREEGEWGLISGERRGSGRGNLRPITVSGWFSGETRYEVNFI